MNCNCVYPDGKHKFYDVRGNKIHLCNRDPYPHVDVDPELLHKCELFIRTRKTTTWAAFFWLTTEDKIMEAAEWFARQITQMEAVCPNDQTPEATKVDPSQAHSYANSTATAQQTVTTPVTPQSILSSPSKTLTNSEMTI